jgi:agmatine deiminase
MKRLCFLVALFVAALLLSCGIASADPSSLNRALEMIASTKPSPLLNLRPDPYLYARLMEQNGRLAELGLTFQEGVTFAEAALVRQGVKSAASRTAAPRAFADSAGAEAPPAGPVHKAAEFEPVVGVFVSYPTTYAPWYPFFDGILAALDGDPKITVYLLCQDAADETALRARIASTGRTGSNFTYLQIATDSNWTRDFGPLFIRFKDSGRQVEGIVDLAYYWGAYPLDDAFPANLANAWSMQNFPLDLYFEGGNFMTDGAGTGFACTGLTSDNRVYSRTQIEAKMKAYLGCEKLILVEPLSFERTKHIDIFAKLLDPTTILVGQYEPGDPNYDRLEQTAAQLSGATNLAGKPFQVIRIPMPPTYLVKDPTWGWLTVYPTYTNSTILNKKVLVPVFNLPQDDAGLKVYKDFFTPKGMEVIHIDSQEVIKLGGAVHCLTLERARFLRGSPLPAIYELLLSKKWGSLSLTHLLSPLLDRLSGVMAHNPIWEQLLCESAAYEPQTSTAR